MIKRLTPTALQLGKQDLLHPYIEYIMSTWKISPSRGYDVFDPNATTSRACFII